MIRLLNGERGRSQRIAKLIHSSFSSSYIPVLMAQAKIYWDRRNYQQVEKIFRKSVEFCSEHDVWKLNVAHVVFMQVCLSVCDMYLSVSLSVSSSRRPR